MADRQHEILFTADIPTLDSMKTFKYLASTGYGVYEIVRSRAVSTLALYFDFQLGRTGEKRPRADTNITFVEIRNVVHSVHLVHVIEAAFFDHWLCSTRTFFSRLEKEPHTFVRRDAGSFFQNDLSG